MPGLKHGFERAATGIIMGFVTNMIFKELMKVIGFSSFLLLISFLSIVAIVELANKMKYWSLYYLFGWLIGIILFGFLLAWWELLLYFGVAMAIMLRKFK